MVTLLPKPDTTSYRPLSLTQVAWRLGIGCWLDQLKPWISQWAPIEVSGAVPSRDISLSHARLQHFLQTASTEHTPYVVVSEDLAKAFDSVHAAQPVSILVRLGMPMQLASVLLRFYSHSRRCFSFQGEIADR